MNTIFLKTAILGGVFLLGSCKCYDSKEQAVEDYLDYGFSQSIQQIVTGRTNITILNSSTDLVFRITKIGIRVQPAVIGGEAVRFRNTQILLNPGQIHEGFYNLDIGDRVRSAYPLMDNISITCFRD